MTKESKRKTLVKSLDKIFSVYIRLKYGHCVVCLKREGLQCGHLFSRVAYSTRWDEDNAFGQCAGCNLRHEHDPYPLTNYFLKRFGQDKYDELYRRHKKIKKHTDQDLQKLILYYGDKIHRLGGAG